MFLRKRGQGGYDDPTSTYGDITIAGDGEGDGAVDVLTCCSDDDGDDVRGVGAGGDAEICQDGGEHGGDATDVDDTGSQDEDPPPCLLPPSPPAPS